MRSDPSDAAAYYEVNVTGATQIVPDSGSLPKDATVTITLAITTLSPKDEGLPNDHGWMTAVVKGREWRFRLVETAHD